MRRCDENRAMHGLTYIRRNKKTSLVGFPFEKPRSEPLFSRCTIRPLINVARDSYSYENVCGFFCRIKARKSRHRTRSSSERDSLRTFVDGRSPEKCSPFDDRQFENVVSPRTVEKIHRKNQNTSVRNRFFDVVFKNAR